MTNEKFEQWYVENAFDYVSNPIGSRDCGLQRKAWNASREAAEKELAAMREQEPAFWMIDGILYQQRQMDKNLKYFENQTPYYAAPTTKPGFVMVPVEPSDASLIAGNEAMCSKYANQHTVRGVYCAMINAYKEGKE